MSFLDDLTPAELGAAEYVAENAFNNDSDDLFEKDELTKWVDFLSSMICAGLVQRKAATDFADHDYRYFLDTDIAEAIAKIYTARTQKEMLPGLTVFDSDRRTDTASAYTAIILNGFAWADVKKG